MKNTVIDNNHCGQYYNLLVDQVDQGDIISKATLCWYVLQATYRVKSVLVSTGIIVLLIVDTYCLEINDLCVSCSSHDRFKQCVLTETREACDRGNPDGAASRFSKQIIDKALSFLQDQCYNYM